MEEPQLSGWFYRLAPHLVLGNRRDPPAAEPSDRILVVKSGGAFPLGHPTTRLCLDLLREALAGRPVNRLVDMGCGAGVLGLAAAALGVRRVAGVDLSWPAVQATGENARENGLAGRMVAVQGSTECLKVPFDLVVANLPWEVQMDKAPELHRLAAPGGRLILSGFRDNQENLLGEIYRKRGWSWKKRLTWDFYHAELPPDLSFTWAAWLLDSSSG